MSVSSPEDLSDAIAVIGMSCNFPGASSCEQYWQNLQKGVESTTRFTREELLAAGVPESLVDDPRYVPVNGVIKDVELFDADYFGLPPKEASLTDPQHRVFLECAHQALENAGYDSNRYAGEIAVYAGTGPSSYLLRNLLNNPDVKNSSDFQLVVGNTQDFLSTRVGYKLNLTGPCITVGTACSTSLVAIHMACQALLDFQSDMALVGGVSLQLPQTRGYLFEESGILSPDGSCRAFDQAAAGTVNGNGAGVVLLKRYEDAVADGDKIRAIVRGSAVNNDGAAKVGFTAPSVDGQIKVVAEALQSAGIEADDIDYIETHGTATALGDSIEIKALKSVFETQSSRKNFCALGSVKTNFGHLDAAAGIAGFIKTVLALEHQQIPASLHFDVANPSLKLEQSPFYVNAALQPWQGEEKTRFAGISSFGIGGTNAHVILQEAPILESFADQSEENRHELVVLSAKSESALKGMMRGIQHYLCAPLGQPGIVGYPESGATDSLKNIAFTLAKGRTEHRYRGAWTASSAGDLLDQLVRTIDSARLADEKPLTAPKVVFMFPGQGSQSVGMAAGLYRCEAVFKHLVDECLQQLKPPFFERVKDLLLNEVKQESHSGGSDNHTQWVQPALFILEYALAKLWMHKGVTPDLLIGHSIGEYVASCISGVLKVEDAIELVCKRAELMQSAPSGSMLAVPLPEAEIACFLSDKVSLAAVNTLSQCVLSGETEALAIIADKIPGSIKLNTSHGFHSQLMDPVLADFGAVSRGLELHDISIPYVSNLTGDYITAEDLSSGSYWQEHLRSTVRFAHSIETFLTDNSFVCIELGVGKVLSRMVSSIENQGSSELKPAVKIEGLRLDTSPEDIDGYFLNRLGMAWAAGINLDWDAYYEDRSEQFQRVELPTYVYDRQRHWIDSPAYKNLSRESTSPSTGPLESSYEERLPFDKWFQTPTWIKVVGLEARSSEANWLLINGDKSRGGLVDYLQGKLHDGNSRVEKIGGLAELDSCITEMDLSANKLPFHVVYWLKGSVKNPYEDYFNIVTLANTLSELNRHASIVLLSPVFFQVLSDEDSHVNSALALGTAKVITQEYPLLVCRLIDSDVNEGDSRQGNVSLLKALLHSQTCSVDSLLPTTPLAIRNGCIWKQQYQTLPSAGITGSPLTRNGVYLITGGLGGVGMILADYLAEHYQAKLLLLGRSEIDLSAAGELTSPVVPEPAFKAILNQVNCTEQLTEIVKMLSIAPLRSDSRLVTQLNKLCAVYILHFWQQCGFMFVQGQQFDLESLVKQLNLDDAFEPCIGWFAQVLVEDGYLSRQKGGQFRALLSSDSMPALEPLHSAVLAEQHEFRGTIELLKHCVEGYYVGLKGEVPAISILYPEGSDELLANAGENTFAHSLREPQMHFLAKQIAELAKCREGKPLRILEVGVGDGILAGIVAPALKDFSVEYTATDLSPLFAEKNRQKAKALGLDFCQFKTLDISKDPLLQGFCADEYDLILALDVIHATENIQTTLTNLQLLLADGGSIALIEAVLERRWITMIWGLAKGWWNYSDERVESHSPLLSISDWNDKLLSSGFESVDCVSTGVTQTNEGPPESDNQQEGDYALIIGHKAAAIDTRQRILKRIERMEDKGSEVIALSADVGSDADIEGVATLIESRFGKLDGIIHAAGITQREFIFNLLGESTESVTEDVFYPKISGTLALESLAKRFNPAFCLLISSNAATLGGIGIGAYSAASCWLDGYAQAKKTCVSDYPFETDDGLGKNSVRWISSNWDGWPTEETTGLESDFKTSIDRYKMTVSESERAFETVLASGVSQVVVSAGGLDDRLRHLEGLSTVDNPKSANLNRESQASDLTPSPDQSAAQEAFVSWHSDTERYVASVWCELLGVKHVTPNDDFFDLHGDSLVGTQLIARISKDKNIKIPFRMLFEKTQLRQFALGVEDLCGQPRGGETEPTSSAHTENIIDDCGEEEGTI
jgi:acyl transferase domain-containing protein/short-subunit dehydrogenase involved in D-alanine esterification of teichoic acids/SAM-dependent methyltransferase/acyl carrier protein